MMKRHIRPLIAAAIAVVVLGSAGLAQSAGDRGGSAREPVADPPATAAGAGVAATHGLKSCAGSGALNFGHYYLGRKFEGLRLKAVLRDCDKPVAGEPYPGRTNVISYVYGDCKVSKDQDSGCLPPLQVDSAPACEDNLSLYSRYPDAQGNPPPHKSVRLRSTRAASFDGGRQLEIYTGETTITVSGDDPKQVRRAASMLSSGPRGLRVRLNTEARAGAGLSALATATKAAAASGRSKPAVAARTAMAKPARGATTGHLSC